MSQYNSLDQFNSRISKKAERDCFCLQWQAFIRTFRSPENVVRNFNVSFQTAMNWWHGRCCPMGDDVNLAWREHPEAARVHLGGRLAA